MSKVQGVSPGALHLTIHGETTRTMDTTRSGKQEISDMVEISELARLMSMIYELPEVRAELVEQVKAEIAAGEYERPERIEAAVDKLMEELFPGR